MQWCFFVGCILGVGRTYFAYGNLFCRSMMLKMCFKTGFQSALLLLPMNYFLHPLCQWNQTGALAVMPHEMKFKNYMDKKYGMYDEADKMFYRSLTNSKRVKELKDRRA
jgi:hypothetical protein